MNGSDEGGNDKAKGKESGTTADSFSSGMSYKEKIIVLITLGLKMADDKDLPYEQGIYLFYDFVSVLGQIVEKSAYIEFICHTLGHWKDKFEALLRCTDTESVMKILEDYMFTGKKEEMEVFNMPLSNIGMIAMRITMNAIRSKLWDLSRWHTNIADAIKGAITAPTKEDVMRIAMSDICKKNGTTLMEFIHVRTKTLEKERVVVVFTGGVGPTNGSNKGELN